MNVFPELRMGELPSGDDYGDGEDGARSAIRELLVGASIIAFKQGVSSDQPDEQLDFKRMIEYVAELDPVHQVMLWKLYWEGSSMRNLATEWEMDELNVIREHKVVLAFLAKSFAKGKPIPAPKVRPGLRTIGMKVRKDDPVGPFRKLLKRE
jgi:hypothetical protein